MRKHITLLAFGALTLSACQHVENFDTVRTSRDPVVNKVENDLDISFAYGSSHLDKVARERIETFIMAYEVSRLDDIEIEIAQQGGTLAQDRAETVAAYFRHFGLKPHYRVVSDEENLQTVDVTLAKYTVQVPNCPDWTDDPSNSFNNQVHSNFGCANAANLAMMVGDPRDLLRGRDLTTADSKVLHNGIDLYRNPTERVHKDTHNNVNVGEAE